ncbi:transporter substrate-binding domain-containing protein [Microbispora sp. SCL1-1]|uniref:protein kinase domain-containing protein n=1 Tax=unclassified Microbispora TaxID=2614687 RepID=UPI001157A243|nr:transporter substrate-binding domain-containing protein [Microbispora sp. SCL1-1]NJP24244.1 transporter substrate-binding domain-containing protein [Microbispora sp. CL1-1]TQS15042.1 transporter substrate-binding domain-containing protein [Microbispora sp. SCL1-1]
MGNGMPQIAPLQPGDPTNLGPFVLSGRLGEGGQGVVYFGQDEAGERAAVKLLHVKFSGDATARSRFARELRAAQRVASFCTARVLAADLEGDTPYIASEFIDGRSLRETVEEDGPLTGSSLERLAVGTATALTAIHQAGIVHRDFKPDNVLLAVDGPRVVDFGIARILDSTATITSRAIGTPAYMAPEQISGGTVGPPADVFSWASTIAFAATGDVVFGGNSIAVVLNRILNHDIDTGMLPEPLGGVVRACLRKSPDERPAADQILLRLLGRAVSGDASAVVLSEGAAHAADPDALARTGPVRAPATGGAGRLPTGGARTGTGAGAGSGPAVGSGPGAGSGVWTGTGDHAGHAGNAGQAGHAANAGQAGHAANAGRARNVGHAGNVSQGGHGGNAGQAGHAGNAGQGGHAANAGRARNAGHAGNVSQGGHGGDAGQAGNDASTGASQSASLSGPTNPRFGAVPREGTGGLGGHATVWPVVAAFDAAGPVPARPLPGGTGSAGTGPAETGPGDAGAYGVPDATGTYGMEPGGTGPGGTGPSGTGPSGTGPGDTGPGGGARRRRRGLFGALAAVLAVVAAGTAILAAKTGFAFGDASEDGATGAVVTPRPKPAYGSVYDKARQTKRLTIGVRWDVPGVGLEQASGFSGFDVDVATAIARRLNVPANGITFRRLGVGDRVRALTDGTVDMVVATYSYDDNRNDAVTFAGPYYTAHTDLLVLSGSRIKKLADLAGRRMCAPVGSVSARLVADKVGVEQVPVNDYAECMNLLTRGEVDAVPGDDLIIAGFANRVASLKLSVLGVRLTDQRYAVGLPKRDLRTCRAVEDAISGMYGDGTMRDLLRKHFGNVDFAPEQDVPPKLACR